MNVSLTPELEKLVNERVRSGMYGSASEVVREALRLLKEQEELRRRLLEELRREVGTGLEQANRGEGAPLNIAKIKSRLRKRLRQARSVKNPWAVLATPLRLRTTSLTLLSTLPRTTSEQPTA